MTSFAWLPWLCCTDRKEMCGTISTREQENESHQARTYANNNVNGFPTEGGLRVAIHDVVHVCTCLIFWRRIAGLCANSPLLPS